MSLWAFTGRVISTEVPSLPPTLALLYSWGGAATLAVNNNERDVHYAILMH
jgi:hypothetical protein